MGDVNEGIKCSCESWGSPSCPWEYLGLPAPLAGVAWGLCGPAPSSHLGGQQNFTQAPLGTPLGMGILQGGWGKTRGKSLLWDGAGGELCQPLVSSSSPPHPHLLIFSSWQHFHMEDRLKGMGKTNPNQRDVCYQQPLQLTQRQLGFLC